MNITGPSPREYIMRSATIQARLQRWLALDTCARYRSVLGSPAEQTALRQRQRFFRALYPGECNAEVRA